VITVEDGDDEEYRIYVCMLRFAVALHFSVFTGSKHTRLAIIVAVISYQLDHFTWRFHPGSYFATPHRIFSSASDTF
jgi:hypothetical protein